MSKAVSIRKLVKNYPTVSEEEGNAEGTLIGALK